MPLIRETIVTTVKRSGEPHLAPLGLIAEGERWILAPFHPSTTLDNLREAPFAVANLTDDVRVFAGCLPARRDWPLTPATSRRAAPGGDFGASRARGRRGAGRRAAAAFRLPRRPSRFARAVSGLQSRASGGDRGRRAGEPLAYAAAREVEAEFARLEVIVGKTAGAAEAEAWGWLKEKRRSFSPPANAEAGLARHPGH